MSNTSIMYPVYELFFFTGLHVRNPDVPFVVHRTGIRPQTGRSAEALCRLAEERAFGRISPKRLFLVYVGGIVTARGRRSFTPFAPKKGWDLIDDYTWAVPMVMPLTWKGHEVPVGIPANPDIYDWCSPLNVRGLCQYPEDARDACQGALENYREWLGTLRINNVSWFTDRVFESFEKSI